MPQMLKIVIFILVLQALPRSANAEPLRTLFRNKDHYIKIEVLNDTLIHFETGRGAGPSQQTSIPTTPQVFNTHFEGSPLAYVSGNRIQTRTTAITVNSDTLCFSVTDLVHDQTLTKVCPEVTDLELKLTMTKESMNSIYGLGEKFRASGQANGDWLGDERLPGTKEGNALTSFEGGFTANMEIPVMYALGPNNLNYALFVDHAQAQDWNFKQNPWSMTTHGSALRFYVITGVNLPEIRQQFVSLVGTPPIPPKKAFGLWVSQYGYKKFSEVDERLAILRAKKFPVDGFVMDLDWFGGIAEDSPNTRMGTLKWDEKAFPEPGKRISDYKNQSGVGLMLIEEPYAGEALKEFAALKKSGALVVDDLSGLPTIFSGWWGKGGMIDYTNDQTSSKWHDLKRQPLVNMGVFGHWTDLGEPGEPEETATGMKYHGVDGVDGTDAAHMHNLFNFKWHESIAKGYLKNHTLQRPFMLSRSGTTGIERFGGAFWSGDIAGRITSLAAHLNAQMHMSFSGFDYFGADIGGFHRESYDGEHNQTYTRWFAHGAAFDVPVRPHTCIFKPEDRTSPAEEGWIESNLSNLRQRYELIPYYYSLAYRASNFGEPVFPPLVYYYQNDPNVRGVGSEKLIGRDILVATEASQAFMTNVYLPQGDWIDYLTFQKFHVGSGGRWLKNFPLVRNNLFKLPTFIRSGAILPKALVDDKTWNALGKRGDGKTDQAFRLQVFPDTSVNSFSVYEDDGESVNYKSGESAITTISQQKTSSGFLIDIAAARGKYKPQGQRVNIIDVVLDQSDTVSSVILNGKPLQKLDAAGEIEKKSGWKILPNNHLIINSGKISVDQNKHFVVNI